MKTTGIYSEEARRLAAKEANLHYVSDAKPGISRKRYGKGFMYFSPEKERITNTSIIARIQELAIPPAYSSIWICPLENGHIQATGRDERKRKQYRYHAKWEEVRNANKFHQLGQFAEQLPRIRAKVEEHMSLSGLPRERVMATLIQLMDKCHIRIGNAQYASQNQTYGLTTLTTNHVKVKGNRIFFEFTGKSGKPWKLDMTDRRVANTVRKCEEISGHELFKYIGEDGKTYDVTSDDVNAYIQEISGAYFTAKDFRTWAATSQAIGLLSQIPPVGNQREIKKLLNATVKTIAAEMGHTPAICRKCYIHPKVLEIFQEGALHDWHARQQDKNDHQLVNEFLSAYS